MSLETLFQSYWQAEHLSTRLAISQVHDHIRYLCIRIDALDAGKAAAGAAQCLSDEQLQRLDQGLKGYYVIEWRLITLVQQAPVLRCLMPFKVSLFPLALGPEITRDWLYPRDGHGFPIKDMHASWQNIVKFNVQAESSTGTNVIFQLNRKRFVVNSARDTVITYFDTDYGT